MTRTQNRCRQARARLPGDGAINTVAVAECA
jgi:hypothetical protein